MTTSMLTNEEMAVGLPPTQRGSIAVNDAIGTTVIGDSAQVNYHNTATTFVNVTVYEQPVTGLVERRINQLEGKEPSNQAQIFSPNRRSTGYQAQIPQKNLRRTGSEGADCDGRRPPEAFQKPKRATPVPEYNGDYDIPPVRSQEEKKRENLQDLHEKKLVRNEDEEVNLKIFHSLKELTSYCKNLYPHSQPVIRYLAYMACEASDPKLRRDILCLMIDVLFEIHTERFALNSCGSYDAEATFRKFLLAQADIAVINVFAPVYTLILSLLIKRGIIELDKKTVTKLSKRFKCIGKTKCSRHSKDRRNAKAVAIALERSIKPANVNELKGVADCIDQVNPEEYSNVEQARRFCKDINATENDWYHHYLIIIWLTMKVLDKKTKIWLTIMLHVTNHISQNFHNRHRTNYQWKLISTVIENLMEIATRVPDLLETVVHGMVDLHKEIQDRKISVCLDLFQKHAKPLIFIVNDNEYLLKLLLNNIFINLEISSIEILREGISLNLPSHSCVEISEKQISNDKNTISFSGKLDNRPVSIKCLKIMDRKQLGLKEFEREISILGHVKHESNLSIANIIHSSTNTMVKFMIFDFLPKDSLLNRLRKRRTNNQRLELADRFSILIQLLEGMKFLMKKNVVHLRIQAKNVYVTEYGRGNCRVKLCNFSSSRRLNNLRETCDENTIGPTEIIENKITKWMAPEGLSKGELSFSTDIFAFGICMFEICTDGCVPYNNWTSHQSKKKRQRKPMTAFQASIYVSRCGQLCNPRGCIPEPIFKIILECTNYDPKKRPDVEKLFKSVESAQVIMEELSNNLPENRPQPTPAELVLLKEDEDEDISGVTYMLSDNDEIIGDQTVPFAQLSVLDTCWNETRPHTEEDYDVIDYTHIDPQFRKPILCCADGHYEEDYQNNLVVLEKMSFKQLEHAKKLVKLKNSSVVKVLAVNQFGLEQLEMVSEYLPRGNVLCALLSNPILRGKINTYMHQAALAICYLHGEGILHCAIRAENVLLVNEDQIKVGCLGYSCKELIENAVSKHPSRPIATTDPRWDAPEIWEDGKYSRMSDSWSFAVFLWEILKASTCFQEQAQKTQKSDVLPYKNCYTDHDVRQFVRDGNRLTNPCEYSDVYDICRDCWNEKWEKRISMDEVAKRLDGLNPNDGIYTPLLHDDHEIANFYEPYRKQPQGYIDCKGSPTAICENCSGMDETCQMTNSDHDDCEMGRATSGNGGFYNTRDDEYSDIEYNGIASTSLCNSMKGSYKTSTERIRGNKETFPGMILNKEHQYDQNQDDNNNYDDVDDDDDNDNNDHVYDAIDDDDNDNAYNYPYEDDNDEEDNYDDGGGGGGGDDKHDVNVDDGMASSKDLENSEIVIYV